MVRSNLASANSIADPAHDKLSKQPADNSVNRILENNKDMVATLGIVLGSYKSIIAGTAVCNAAVIRQLEQILSRSKELTCTVCMPFLEERRMKSAEATNLHRKSGRKTVR
jgi:hypothetical protein